MESIGQNPEVWTNEWKGLSVESEIRMWDYYGVRPYILKYTPRKGKVLEAGCGLGRYNFYLSHLGIDITGLDFSIETINYLNKWKNENGYQNVEFIVGDVKKLPYDDNSLSGYLSFGVIEHFIEGPKEVLDEVYRVLKPGGIAIITTPNKSWNVRKNNLMRKTKDLIKKLIRRKIIKNPFFQYEYTPRQLEKFLINSNLYPLVVTGTDFLYSFVEYGNFEGKNIRQDSFEVKLSPILDNSFLRRLGSQSVTISTKLADNMQCFFCGNQNATRSDLKNYTVPICRTCQKEEELSKYYRKGQKTYFHNPFIIKPEILQPHKRKCEFCKLVYETDKLFETFGFSKNVCPSCLKVTKINLLLSNEYIQPIWRERK